MLATKAARPADAAVMRKAGLLSGDLTIRGQPVGDGDAVIGATAEIIEEPVLTRNVADFERRGVDAETY